MLRLIDRKKLNALIYKSASKHCVIFTSSLTYKVGQKRKVPKIN